MAGGFDSLGLMPELIRSINDLNWNLPTDVQDETIPLILGGGDVMVSSETGSGKTGSFGLPMIQCVYEKKRNYLNKTINKIEKKKKTQFHVIIGDDKDGLLCVNDGIKCENNNLKQWAGARATHGVRSGIYYYECTITGPQNGIPRIGWSTKAANLELGKDIHGYGYGGTGKKSSNNNFEDYGQKYGPGDIIGCLLNITTGEIAYTKNGQYLGVAFTFNNLDTVFFPAILLKGTSVLLNFGETPFHYDFPNQSIFNGVRSLFNASPNDIVEENSTELLTNKNDGSISKPLAIILEPAKDLAEQVYESIQTFSTYVVDPPVTSLLLVGGDNTQKQKEFLRRGVDVIIGTPAKILDLYKQGAADLSAIKFFILDEADRLVDGDNLPTVLELFNACPVYGKGLDRLQVCFFSATLHSPAITQLAATICTNPTWVDLKGKDSVPETVHHCILRVDLEKHWNQFYGLSGKLKQIPVFLDGVHTSGRLNNEEENSLRLKELKQRILIKIIDHFQMTQCIIFCRTNLDCNNLENFLCSQETGVTQQKFTKQMETGKENKYSCAVLAGMRSLNDRRESLNAFREGSIRFLIATDVAARGLDITGLPYIINMTLPEESENYIHRIGRVGRADRMGLALSIVSPENVSEKVWYHTCSNKGKDGNCTRRQLVENGGCTINYNENEKLNAIEKRLDMKIPELDPDTYNLPEELASQNIQYGEIYEEDEGKLEKLRAKFHFDEITPAMKQLCEMEYQSQNMFLRLQHEFS